MNRVLAIVRAANQYPELQQNQSSIHQVLDAFLKGDTSNDKDAQQLIKLLVKSLEKPNAQNKKALEIQSQKLSAQPTLKALAIASLVAASVASRVTFFRAYNKKPAVSDLISAADSHNQQARRIDRPNNAAQNLA